MLFHIFLIILKLFFPCFYLFFFYFPCHSSNITFPQSFIFIQLFFYFSISNFIYSYFSELYNTSLYFSIIICIIISKLFYLISATRTWNKQRPFSHRPYVLFSLNTYSTTKDSQHPQAINISVEITISPTKKAHLLHKGGLNNGPIVRRCPAGL